MSWWSSRAACALRWASSAHLRSHHGKTPPLLHLHARLPPQHSGPGCWSGKAMLSDDSDDVFHAPRRGLDRLHRGIRIAHCGAAFAGRYRCFAGSARQSGGRHLAVCCPVLASCSIEAAVSCRLLAWSSVRAARSCALAEMRAVACENTPTSARTSPITARKLTCTCHTLRTRDASTCG